MAQKRRLLWPKGRAYLIRRFLIRNNPDINLWSETDAWDNDPGTGVALNRFRHKTRTIFFPAKMNGIRRLSTRTTDRLPTTGIMRLEATRFLRPLSAGPVQT